MKSKVFFIVIMLQCLVLKAYALNWEEIRKAASQIKSISAEFIQEKHIKILKKPMIAAGIFFYQSPDSLRWEYKNPIKSIMMVHKGNAKRYICEAENTFTEDTSMSNMNIQVAVQQMTEWLSGRFNENSAFSAQFTDNNKIIITPKEKSMSSFIQKIEIVFSEKPGIIDSVTIFESIDSYTIIKYKNTKLNTKLYEAAFINP